MPRSRRIRLTPTWLLPALLGAVVVTLASGGAVAAIETNTVTNYWRGLWWAVSLITTVGFVGEPPETTTGAILSVVLMILGFLLLAMVSASLAAMFVREEEEPRETREEAADAAILAALDRVERRLDDLEGRLETTAPDHVQSELPDCAVEPDPELGVSPQAARAPESPTR